MKCPRGCCATYREHLQSLRMGVTSAQTIALRQEDRDMDAYKRLRESGARPPGIAGAATLEREASTSFEVENAAILKSAPERRKLVKALQDAPPPSTTPLDAA